MRRSRAGRLVLALLVGCAGRAWAEAPGAAEEAQAGWSGSVSAYTYFVPEDDDYVLPILSADRGRLHLEARYNYEALDAGSVWVGGNFSGGEEPAWEITPMLGGVFGEATGLAPGYRGSLSGWKLELYSEGEYVFDAEDSAENFCYNWSELTFAPRAELRFGLVTQRTRAYESERDIQRGLLAGGTWGRVDLAAYVFNPDDSRPLVVASISVEF